VSREIAPAAGASVSVMTWNPGRACQLREPR
jgi:hypothetical protein